MDRSSGEERSAEDALGEASRNYRATLRSTHRVPPLGLLSSLRTGSGHERQSRSSTVVAAAARELDGAVARHGLFDKTTLPRPLFLVAFLGPTLPVAPPPHRPSASYRFSTTRLGDSLAHHRRDRTHRPRRCHRRRDLAARTDIPNIRSALRSSGESAVESARAHPMNSTTCGVAARRGGDHRILACHLRAEHLPSTSTAN